MLPIAAVSFAVSAYLLTLRPAPAGRVYAAYDVVYVMVALIPLWTVEGITPSSWDVGVATTPIRMDMTVGRGRHA